MTFTSVVAVLTILVIFWLRRRKRFFSVFESLGIPGPKPNILFGNLLEMKKKGIIEAQSEWIGKYGKVLGFYLGTTPALLVADIEILKLIQIKNFDKFSDRANLFTIDDSRNKELDLHIQRLKGQHWRRVRSLISPAFTTGKIKQMMNIFNKTDDIFQEIDKTSKMNDDINIYELYKYYSLDVICQAALGIYSGFQDESNRTIMKAFQVLFQSGKINWTYILSKSFSEFRYILTYINRGAFSLTWSAKVNPLQEFFTGCRAAINLRKTNPDERRNDLLQGLIDSRSLTKHYKYKKEPIITDCNEYTSLDQEKNENNNVTITKEDKLTDLEICINSLSVLLAGYDTTSTSLAFVTYCLVKYPEIQEKVYKEIVDAIDNEKGQLSYNSLQNMKYMEQVIQETLRLYPPFHQGTTREAGEEIQLGTWRIPKGMAVIAGVYHVHHDASYWNDPEKFNPERFGNKSEFSWNTALWLPFSAGPRNCVGMKFAMTEMKLVLAKLLLRYRLIPGEQMSQDFQMLNEGRAGLKPKTGIYIKAVLRNAYERI